MKNLVVLTGAGISAESGISTFRDSGGLWEQYRIEDVATPEGWARDPKLVTDFYNQRRKQLLEVEPNYGHIALVELEKYFNVYVVTLVLHAAAPRPRPRHSRQRSSHDRRRVARAARGRRAGRRLGGHRPHGAAQDEPQPARRGTGRRREDHVERHARQGAARPRYGDAAHLHPLREGHGGHRPGRPQARGRARGGRG